MRNFTKAALRTRCQQRCDMEGQDFISDTEWDGLMTTAFGEFRSILDEAGMRIAEKIQEIAAGALADDGNGGAFIELPCDHLTTVGVDRYDNPDWRQLHLLMAQERNVLTRVSAEKPVAYTLVGCNLHIYPATTNTYTLRHIYVPQPEDFADLDDAEEIDVVTPDGENFIIWAVAVMALAKEESDVRLALSERARFRERVEQWATLRSLYAPNRRIVEETPAWDIGGYGDGYDSGDWY